MGDYTFTIGLLRQEDVPPEDPSVPPKVALVRAQLQALLEAVSLTSGGGEVRVDGFRFEGETEVYPIWPTER